MVVFLFYFGFFSEYLEGVLFLSLSEVVMMSESVRVCCLHLSRSIFCLKNPAVMLAMSKWSVTPSVSSVGCGELMGGLYLVF